MITAMLMAKGLGRPAWGSSAAKTDGEAVTIFHVGTEIS